MKTVKFLQFGWMTGVLALGCTLLFSAKTVRANVYATDIQINGNLTGTLVPEGSPLSITYHLNQTADQGVTVSILNGATVVAAIPGGTNMGINSVSWTPANTGTYSVSITAILACRLIIRWASMLIRIQAARITDASSWVARKRQARPMSHSRQCRRGCSR